MPTETFLHLPAAKREKLREAIFREFSRVPFQDVSINRIVQDAGIARGSYYQYFHGKEDLLNFVLSECFAYMRDFMDRATAACSGNAFSLVLCVYDEAARIGLSGEHRALCENLFSRLRVMSPSLFATTGTCGDMRDCLAPHLDRSILNAATDEDYRLVQETLLIVLRRAVAELFQDPARANDVRRCLARTLLLLQEGLMKKENPPHAF